MLIDKGYYDYDYEQVPPPPTDAADTVMDDKKLHSVLANFGIGVDKDKAASDLQARANID